MFTETACVPIVLILCLCRHFNTDSLICDCNLRWVLQWARNASVRIAEETVCAYPRALHGLSLYNLKESQLICGELYSILQSEVESRENIKNPQKLCKKWKLINLTGMWHLRMKENRKNRNFLSQEHHCSAKYSVICCCDIKHLTMLLVLHCIYSSWNWGFLQEFI